MKKLLHWSAGTGLILAAVLLWGFYTHSAQAATLALSPSSQTVSPGQIFTVTIRLDTTSTGIVGADVNTLNYDPTVLEVQDADAATAGIQISAGGLMSDTVYNSVDATAGRISFSQVTAPGSANYSGVGTLATITFKALRVASSNVTFTFTAGSTTDTNVVNGTSDVLTGVTNGSYTVADTTAPARSNGSPTGNLAAGTTSVTLAVSTDEAATCRYGTTANTAYNSIASTFSTTGGTSHSANITGLTNGTSRTYYIRCRDSAGNMNNDDYPIAFTVSTPPNQSPTGYFDGIDASGKISGWAQDPDNTGTAISVHIYIDANAGSAGASPIAITAGDFRSDVGNHAFNYTLPVNSPYRDGQAHQVWVWGLDLTSTSNNIQLQGSPRSFTLAPPDSTPPTISSLAQSSVTTNSATITWTTNEASDSQIDYGTSTSYGSSSTLNASMVTSHSVAMTGLQASTTYHVRARSRDAAGNLALSADLAFTTASPADTTAPSVSISAPANNTTVSGTVTVSATASDNVGVVGVKFYVDGTLIGTEDTSSPYSASLNTATLSNAAHTLTAIARDAANNQTTSSAVNVTVNNVVPKQPVKLRLTAGSLEGLTSISTYPSASISALVPSTGSVIRTTSYSADASGDYTVSFQQSDPQIVNLRVRIDGYLAKVITNIDTTVLLSNSINIPQLLAGDFNNDGLINSLDYSLMNGRWNQNYSAYDINKDGIINSLDFARIYANWLKSGE